MAERGKRNCWEFHGCGREPGGEKVAELGICPAATESRLDGVNDGTNGGRACWAVRQTLCTGKVEGAFAAKAANCMLCAFYKTVCREQGAEFQGTARILAILKQEP